MVLTSAKATTYVRKMQKKIAKGRQCSRRDNMSRPDHRVATALAKLKRSLIWDDICHEWKWQDETIQLLSRKHNKSPKWMDRQVQRLSSYGQGQRKISPWNAFLHVQSLEVNEGELCSSSGRV
jgi:hypothetical protein